MIKNILLISFLYFDNLAYPSSKVDTFRCLLLYNRYDYKSYSLRFDCGDQMSFTPEFFLVEGGCIKDTGFVFTDSINNKLLNDSNHVLLYSKWFSRYLKKHHHPARDSYTGFHFYLFDAIILVSKESEIKEAHWPDPASKVTSDYKKVTIKEIRKIIQLKPMRSKTLGKSIWKKNC